MGTDCLQEQKPRLEDLNFKYIFRLIASFGIPDSEAEDCFQDLMMMLIRRRVVERYKSDMASFKTYITRAAQLWLLSHRKNYINTKTVSLPDNISDDDDDDNTNNPQGPSFYDKYAVLNTSVDDLISLVRFDAKVAKLLDAFIDYDEQGGYQKPIGSWDIESELCCALHIIGVKDILGLCKRVCERVGNTENKHVKGLLRLFILRALGLTKREVSDLYKPKIWAYNTRKLKAICKEVLCNA